MHQQSDGVAAYRAWAAQQAYLPVLHTPAWLDCVAPGTWQAVVQGGAAWPFVRTRRWGLTLLHNPPLTHRLGPWPPTSPWQPLRSALPRYDRLVTGFHPLHGCPAGVATAPSYVCHPLPEPTEAALLASYSKSWRKHVRHGLALPVLTNELPAAGGALFDAVLAAGGTHRLPPGLLMRIQAAIAGGSVAGQLLVALAHGQPVAAALAVWDAQRTYYIANGRLPTAHRGAVHALTHRLLWHSLQAGRPFDFMGSRLPGVAQFNSGFGAVAEPYARLEVIRHPLLRLRRFLAA